MPYSLLGGRSSMTDGTEAAPGWAFADDTDTGFYRPAANTLAFATAGAGRWQVNGSGHLLAVDDNSYDIGASGATRPRSLYLGTSLLLGDDAILVRDAANTLAQRNGTNEQHLKLYETYTDSTNYARMALKASGEIGYLTMERAGTGTGNLNYLQLEAPTAILMGTPGQVRWKIIAGSTGHFLAENDNLYDIGASGANRPRNLFLAGYSLQKFLVEPNTAGSGSPNVLTAAETRTYLTNEGATAQNYHTLPTAAAGLAFHFAVQDTDFDRLAFSRRVAIRFFGLADGMVWCSAPEDVILHKLRWFQSGGGVSDRQWHDVIGVLRVQGPALDHAYLRRWAADLGLAELLAKALAEAGV